MAHLSEEERSVIAHMLRQKASLREIGRQLGRSHTSISREVKRNGSKTVEYKCATAQMRYHSRLRTRQKARSKVKQEGLQLFCDLLDSTLLTVSQACSFLKNSIYSCSKSRMYQMIREDRKNGGDCWKSLMFSHSVRSFPNRPSSDFHIEGRKRIEERPAVVQLLEEYGHWEVDTVHSKAHKGGVLTIVERTTLRFKAVMIEDLKSDTITKALCALMSMEDVKTITSDNGMEFAGWEDVEKQLGCQFYFARPYRSNDRARNERMNRELRRFFPKGTDFKQIPIEWFERVVERINLVPREKLGWRSANQAAEEAIRRAA